MSEAHLSPAPAPGAVAGGRSAGLELAAAERPRDRALLGALEPDRRVDDWGRSERVEAALDATVGEFLYRHWFRCEVDGLEHVPADGPALLAVNRAGALGPAALMIAKALREEHRFPRPLQIAVDPRYRSVPGVSMLVEKAGGIAAHPANLERALGDERGLVLASPEGPGPPSRYRRRYRLRPFAADGPVEPAVRAGAAIVPVCLVGAEEAMPLTLPWLGRLGVGACLPARFEIRFLPPVRLSGARGEPTADEAAVRAVADELRQALQQGLARLLGERRPVWR